MEYVSLIITVLYALLIARYIQGWIRLPQFKPAQPFKPVTHVTVIVPFRNEKSNLPALLTCLRQQTYPKTLTHFFFVNDQSSDGGDEWLAEQIATHPECTLLQGEGKGKKNALALAYTKANGELLVTLDADCVVHENWLHTLVDYYQQTRHSLIICPVQFHPATSVWENLQAVEFQSLIACGAGAAALNDAIMCNGANLAFRSELVKSGATFLKASEASGDDMFLLEHVKKQNPRKIGFLKSKQAFAYTQPASWSDFFKQRSRWASKSRSYTDFSIIYAGAVVLLINVLLAVGFPLLLCFPLLFKPLLFAFVVKLVVDVLLLAITAPFFGLQKQVPYAFIIAFFYPYYVLYSVINGLWGKLNWKGR